MREKCKNGKSKRTKCGKCGGEGWIKTFVVVGIGAEWKAIGCCQVLCELWDQDLPATKSHGQRYRNLALAETQGNGSSTKKLTTTVQRLFQEYKKCFKTRCMRHL